MLNFQFCNPTKIVFGKDEIAQLSTLIPANARVLITYGGGSVKRFGTLDRVIEALGDRFYVEFGGIEPNPKFETLVKSFDVIKENNIDFLLAVGGGSTIDGTKFINLAYNYDGAPEDVLYDGEKAATVTKGMPLASVLTLPATGSEMNCGGVVTRGEDKLAFFSDINFPVFSILDPTLTYTLPKTQIANGIIDTFIHTVEQYVTFPVDAKIQDRFAEGILNTLVEVAEDCMADENSYDARANFVWAATMGLNGLIGAGVPQDWTTHMMGHEITALFGVDHGKTLAILQPAIWTVRLAKKQDKLAQYGERVWAITEGTVEERAIEAIAKTDAFFNSLGVSTRLSDYGVKTEDVDRLVANLEKHGLTALSETADLTLDIAKEIYLKAL